MYGKNCWQLADLKHIFRIPSNLWKDWKVITVQYKTQRRTKTENVDSRWKVATTKPWKFISRRSCGRHRWLNEYYWKERQTTHRCVFRRSSPLSKATASTARTGEAAWEAAAPELLTRLSAAQQLRAINLALEVQWLIATRRRSHSPACPLWLLLPSEAYSTRLNIINRVSERDREGGRGRKQRFSFPITNTHTHTHTPTHTEREPSILNRGRCLSCTESLSLPNSGLDAVWAHMRLQSWLWTWSIAGISNTSARW